MRNEEKLYHSFGELIYAVAKADGQIQDEEYSKLDELIANHEWERTIKWSFNYERNKSSDPENIFKKVINNCESYGPTPAYREFIDVISKIAEASNGVDEAHLEVPSPRAPCFIAVNKKTGELVWEDNSPALDSKAPAPFDNILHGQWGSPALGEVGGKMQAFMPGGDGVLYAYDVASGDLVWWFDLNPKDSAWELGGRGTRNAIISTPQ